MAKTLTERFSLAGAVTICEGSVAPVRALLLIWGFLVLRNWGVIFEIHFRREENRWWREKATRGKDARYLPLLALLEGYHPLLRCGGNSKNFQLHSIHRGGRSWACATEAKFWHINACVVSAPLNLLTPRHPTRPSIALAVVTSPSVGPGSTHRAATNSCGSHTSVFLHKWPHL